MSTDFFATIREDAPRAQAWREVFGSHEVPLKSPIPQWASAPGIEAGTFYQIDLAELSSEQRARLVEHIAQKFAIAEKEVDEELDTVGCPILSEDVSVTVYHPLRWI